MAHVRKIETNQRRNGKPVAHYCRKMSRPLRREDHRPAS